MQCMNFYWPSFDTFRFNKGQNLKFNLWNFQSRTPILCCSESAAAEIDDNRRSPVKILPLPHHVNTITSTSNPFVKHCVKLRQSSSYRHSHGSVLLVGSTPIRELCSFQGKTEDGSSLLECILFLENAKVSKDLTGGFVRHVTVSSMVMKKLSGLQSTEGLDMVALASIPSTFHNLDNNLHEEDCRMWFPVPHRILVLDGIQDPGNLGTLLRSALAFRWELKGDNSYVVIVVPKDGVFLLSGCCDPFNEKAVRASRGACFQLPIVSGEWTDLQSLRKEFQMRILAGHPASSEDGRLLVSSSLSQRFADSLVDTHLCFVLGAEGSGLSKRSRQESELISIPMAGDFESLNVSVAGGIFLYMLQPQTRPAI